MIFRPIHGAESGYFITQLAGMSFTVVEEGMADSLPPPVRQKDALSKVEDLLHINVGLLERLPELRPFLTHREAGGGTDKRLVSAVAPVSVALTDLVLEGSM